VYLDLPEEGQPVTKGLQFGAIESVKAASDLNAPVTGVISEVNPDIDRTPELINEDPYANWIIKIEINFTNAIGAIGFLFCVFNNLSNSELILWSVVLMLGRKVIPEVGNIAKAIAEIINSKKGAK
jgi:hypothetical protein